MHDLDAALHLNKTDYSMGTILVNINQEGQLLHSGSMHADRLDERCLVDQDSELVPAESESSTADSVCLHYRKKHLVNQHPRITN